MNNNTFRRVEQKYLITNKEYKELMKMIKDFVEKDEYYQSKICSIYFDNNNNDLLLNSIKKPIFKEKFRLRSYDIPNMNSPVYLEIKEKYKGIVGKRRTKLKLKEYYDFLNNKDNQNSQIMKEIKYYFNMYGLEPYVYIGYDRYCYRGKENKNLRITFDYNMKYRFDNLRLEMGDSGEKIIDDGYYIMEIKTLDAMPLWLVQCLSKLKIYPTSFSKVGNVFENRLRSEVLC